MFKIIAFVGAIAGGTTSGIYSHTDFFGDNCPFGGKKCCQTSTASATPSCCATPCPACSKGCDECCDVCDLCCGAATPVVAATSAERSAGYPACCAAFKVSRLAPRRPHAVLIPSPECTSREARSLCRACPTVCGECCGTSVKVAVAGPAAVVAGMVKK